jgi:DNA (cytosine-5)-methyltransferase 1
MEVMGYAFGAVPFPSAGVGAPHIRDRLYWAANAAGAGSQGREQPRQRADAQRAAAERDSAAGRVEHAGHHHDAGEVAASGAGQSQTDRSTDQPRGPSLPSCGLADNDSYRCEPGREGCEAVGHGQAPGADRRTGGVAFSNEIQRGRRATYAAGINDWPQAGWKQGDGEPSGCGIRGIPRQPTTGPTNGFWRDADWLYCRDGRWRPVEPGTFPLAHGASARVGRLRAYGNAINAKAAQVFIECLMDCTP